MEPVLLKHRSVGVAHPNPTLNSILMVEESVREHDGDLGPCQLWNMLPRKINYKSYQRILAYLQDSGKILVDDQISWVYHKGGLARARENYPLVE